VRRWLPIAILAAAQFVMVLDSSVMNVSISQIVADLDTTIQGVQLAITACCSAGRWSRASARRW
jgi:predicted MFS family arabinose efflux permease